MIVVCRLPVVRIHLETVYRNDYNPLSWRLEMQTDEQRKLELSTGGLLDIIITLLSTTL